MMRKPKKPNNLLRQARQKRGWSQRRVAEAIGAYEDRVSRWEAGTTPGKYFQERLCNLFGLDAIQLGFIDLPDIKQQAPTLPKRSVTTSLDSADSMPLVERFLRAVENPSILDLGTIQFLEIRLDEYWKLRHSGITSSSNLLQSVLKDFQQVTHLLESSLLPTMRTHLCLVASALAQLIGHLLFDMGQYNEARAFQNMAIKAAKRADNPILEALAWARASFTWSYTDSLEDARACIQEAERLAAYSPSPTISAYLRAIEAEILARLGEQGACLDALQKAEDAFLKQFKGENTYWIIFNQSRLSSYQGTCFQRLYHPKESKTKEFIIKAQTLLTEALAQLPPTLEQRRPALLVDLASTYARQAEVEGACEYATQAVALIGQIQSHTTWRRLQSLRDQLNVWQDSQAIQTLDSAMTSLLLEEKFQG